MKYISALLCLSIFATAYAGFGYYVPRAVYTIDEYGRQGPLTYINSIPEAFHRVRRQVNPGLFPNLGQPLFNFPQIPIGGPGSTYSGISTTQTVSSGPSGTLSNRFGEDNKVTGQITTTVIKDGQQTTTVTGIGPDGKPSKPVVLSSGNKHPSVLSNRFGESDGTTTVTQTSGNVGGFPAAPFFPPILPFPAIPSFGFPIPVGGNGISSSGGVISSSTGGTGGSGVTTIQSFNSGSPSGTLSNRFGEDNNKVTGQITTTVIKDGQQTTTVQDIGPDGRPSKPVVVSSSGDKKKPSGGLASRFGEDDSKVTGQTVTTVINNGQTTTTTHNVKPDGSVQTFVSKGRQY